MNTSEYKETESHKSDIQDLDFIQQVLEEGIANYVITQSENLWDTDNDRIYRALTFNRGMRYCKVVITPECFIKATADKAPSSLIVEISNILMCCLYDMK